MIVKLMKAAGIRLLTGGKLCGEDIVVTPVLQEKSVSMNGVYTADEGFAGLSRVTVGVQTPAPSLQTLKAVQNGWYEPEEGTDGFSAVTVAIPIYDGTVTVDA